MHGDVFGLVDDVVLRRNDGVPAYNLAVVVDDAAQGVTEVVRGDDLLTSTARQIHLQELLGHERPRYVHVPLVVDADGERLAKRRGLPVTLADLAANGVGERHVVTWIAGSLGASDAGQTTALGDLVDWFATSRIPRDPCPVPSFDPCG